jgi:hypothetical protein
MISEAVARATMGVAPRRAVSSGGPESAPRESSSHAAQHEDHSPATRAGDYVSVLVPLSAGGRVNGVKHSANGDGRGRTTPPMTPIAEDHTVAEERQCQPGWTERGAPAASAPQNGHLVCSDAPPQGSMAFESMRSEPEGTAATAQQWQWQDSSSQILKKIVSHLGMEDEYDEYSSSPGGAADDELQQQAAKELVSPPLRSIRDFHAPRTDLTREEFTLAAVGITISMTEGEPAKIVSAVQGGASVAGVRECDELVSINGVDISSAETNGFDCVELCQQAARSKQHLNQPIVSLGVRDFCSMQLKFVDVQVSGGCPAARLLRERISPRPRASAAPPKPPQYAAKDTCPRAQHSPLPSQVVYLLLFFFYTSPRAQRSPLPSLVIYLLLLLLLLRLFSIKF